MDTTGVRAGRNLGDVSNPSVRHRVLAAAMAVIAEVGPERVRIQDIARRAGMSPGHVMYYFGKRDRILIDVLLQSELDLGLRLQRRVASATDPLDALDRLVRLYLPAGPADVRWTLWAQLFARPPTDRETLHTFTAVTDSWATVLSSIIADGVREGTFMCDGPTEVAYECTRLMDGYSLEVLLGAPGRSRAWAVAQARTAVQRSLGVRVRAS